MKLPLAVVSVVSGMNTSVVMENELRLPSVLPNSSPKSK